MARRERKRVSKKDIRENETVSGSIEQIANQVGDIRPGSLGQVQQSLVDTFDLADENSPYSLFDRGGVFVVLDKNGNEIVSPQPSMDDAVKILHGLVGIDPEDPF